MDRPILCTVVCLLSALFLKQCLVLMSLTWALNDTATTRRLGVIHLPTTSLQVAYNWVIVSQFKHHFSFDDESLGWTFFWRRPCRQLDTCVLISNIFNNPKIALRISLILGDLGKAGPQLVKLRTLALLLWLTHQQSKGGSPRLLFYPGARSDVSGKWRHSSSLSARGYVLPGRRLQSAETRSARGSRSWTLKKARNQEENRANNKVSFAGTRFLWGCQGCLWKSGNTGESEFILPRPFVS